MFMSDIQVIEEAYITMVVHRDELTDDAKTLISHLILRASLLSVASSR